MLEYFEPNQLVYRVTKYEKNSLQEFDLITGSISTIKEEIGVEVQVPTYSKKDQCIYGIRVKENINTICKIKLDGTIEDIKDIENLPIDNYILGTLDENGFFYIKANSTDEYYIVDLSDETLETYCEIVIISQDYSANNDGENILKLLESDLHLVDWTYSDEEELIYAINNEGVLKKINPITGEIIDTIDTSELIYGEYINIYIDDYQNLYVVLEDKNMKYKILNIEEFYRIEIDEEDEEDDKYESSEVNPDENNEVNLLEDKNNQEGEILEEEKTTDDLFEELQLIDNRLNDIASISQVINIADKSEGTIGDEVVYTVAFINIGTVELQDVFIINKLTEGITYIKDTLVANVSVAGDPNSGIKLTDSIKPNQKVAIRFTVKINDNVKENKIYSTAKVEYLYKLKNEEKEFSDSKNSNISIVNILKEEAQIVTNKFTNKDFNENKVIITYTTTLKNIGESVAYNIEFKEEIPKEGVYDGNLSASTEYTGKSINEGITILKINPNEIVAISWDVEIDEIETEILTKTMSLNTLNCDSMIKNSLKTVDKEFADIGDILTYIIQFKNDGPFTAENVIVTDILPEGTSYVYGSLISNVEIEGTPLTNISLANSLEVGAGVSISFKVKVDSIPSNNIISNKAIINYEYINGEVIASVDETNIVTTIIHHGEISKDKLTKEANKVTTTTGDIITYTIKAQNTGNVDIINALIKDVVPIGTSFITGSTTINTLPTSQNPAVGISVGTIVPNQMIIVTFKVKVLETAPSEILNSATVNYEYIVDPNQLAKEVEVTTNTVDVNNLIPEIVIIKSADKEGVMSGEIIRYTLEVENNGDIAALDVFIKDILADGLEYIGNLTLNDVEASESIVTGITIPVIIPGGKVKISFDVKVEDILESNIVFENSANAIFKYQVENGGLTYMSEGISNSIKIFGYKTNVTIEKNVDKELVKLNDIFVYTVTIKNAAELNAENIIIKDLLPNELEVQKVTVNGSVIIGTLENGIPIGGLLKGESLIVEILVKATGELSNPFKNKIMAKVFFRTEINKAPVNIEIFADDAGLKNRDPNNQYKGVIVVKPDIIVTKIADRKEVAIGDNVVYSINIKNAGNVDVHEVVIRDILHSKLKFIPNSVVINDIKNSEENILSGINIGLISVGEIVRVSFEANAIKAGEIPNHAIVNYIYNSETNGIEQAGISVSNIETINASEVKLLVEKTADKKFAILNDEIEYTVVIKNLTKLVANNIIVKDILPRYIEILEGTFSLNNMIINVVDLEKGINIGMLRPREESILKFKVKIISNSHNGQIENGIEVKYNYSLPDGTLRRMFLPATGKQISKLEVGIANFKQFSLENNLAIPHLKPNIEAINSLKGNIDIDNYYIIETSPARSNEGQLLTRYKLILTGSLKLNLVYTSSTPSQSVHLAEYCVAFSNFVVLPINYVIGNKIHVEGVIEDIYSKLMNDREFFTNATVLINVKIVGC